MPEIFPETSPGNFTWDETMGQWVMTVFNHYQWDLNYGNPAVFIEMLDVLLYWANRGADVLRLDAVAFLWKKIGTTSQNEHEAHLILQLLKDCCQVVAPGVLFIAEAIVAPVEIIRYFGEDAVIAKECEIAYNATFMALLWDAVATRNTKLLDRGISSLPNKLDRATWLNYVRCHDDIGLGFDDADVIRAGYEPRAHRQYLLDYFTGKFEGSLARGLPFGVDAKSGDARISGSLASLVGLEAALESGDEDAITESVDLILLLHGMIMSFGGIPLLYYRHAERFLLHGGRGQGPRYALDPPAGHRLGQVGAATSPRHARAAAVRGHCAHERRAQEHPRVRRFQQPGADRHRQRAPVRFHAQQPAGHERQCAGDRELRRRAAGAEPGRPR